MNAVYMTCCDCGKKCIRNSGRQKRCVVCGKAHQKARRKAYQKAYQKSLEYKAFWKAYHKSPEYKAYQKAYQKAYSKLSRDKLKFFRTIAIMGKISKAF